MIEAVGDRAQARFWASRGSAAGGARGPSPGVGGRSPRRARRGGAAVGPAGSVLDRARRFRRRARRAARARRRPPRRLVGTPPRRGSLSRLRLRARSARGHRTLREPSTAPTSPATARRFERPGLAADDLDPAVPNQDLRRAAATGRGSPRTRGQGFLLNWIRVTATRTFIDCGRGRAEAAEIPIGSALSAVLAEPGADPELALLKREHLTHFKAAFAEAVAALDISDRLVLKQHLVEGLTIDQIGGLYHLHRATAARRLAKARADAAGDDAGGAGAPSRAATRAAGRRARAGVEPARGQRRALTRVRPAT